jgi:hypothetical protein
VDSRSAEGLASGSSVRRVRGFERFQRFQRFQRFLGLEER